MQGSDAYSVSFLFVDIISTIPKQLKSICLTLQDMEPARGHLEAGKGSWNLR